jgi:hypothetical protein
MMDNPILRGYTKKVQPVIVNDKLPGAVILIASILLCGVICLFSSCSVTPARADVIDTERLADAIYMAEGGSHTRHPYGILKKYKTTTPRQACINTIKSALRRYDKSDKSVDFISFLGKTYCPTQGKYLTNDEKRLNMYWVNNVKFFLKKDKPSG